MGSLSSKNLKFVFTFHTILGSNMCGCKSCMEEEKICLLEFKAFLKPNDENAGFLLPS